MKKPNILKALHQCFAQVVPATDGRSKIQPLEFVVCLVFCYLGDSKSFSLEAIRRHMINHLDQPLSRSAFWERLAVAPRPAARPQSPRWFARPGGRRGRRAADS